MKRIVYIAAFLMMGFLLGFTLWKEKVYKDTVSKNQKVAVRILNIECASGKGQSSLYFSDLQHKVNHANINRQDCGNYKLGDTVTLLYNEGKDWYYVPSK